MNDFNTELIIFQVLEKFDPALRARARELLKEVFFYAHIVTAGKKKKFPDLQVGRKDKETWPELKYVFDVSGNSHLFIHLLALFKQGQHLQIRIKNAVGKLGPFLVFVASFCPV